MTCSPQRRYCVQSAKRVDETSAEIRLQGFESICCRDRLSTTSMQLAASCILIQAPKTNSFENRTSDKLDLLLNASNDRLAASQTQKVNDFVVLHLGNATIAIIVWIFFVGGGGGGVWGGLGAQSARLENRRGPHAKVRRPRMSRAVLQHNHTVALWPNKAKGPLLWLYPHHKCRKR